MAANASPQKRRASGAHDGPALKKQMAHDSKAVAKAVEKASLPESVINILSEATPACLSTFADQRHPYQTNVVGMVGQALIGVEKALQTAATEAAAALDGLNRTKLQKQIVAEANKRAAAKQAEANQEASLVEAMLNYRLADEELKAKVKMQKAADAECDAAEARKAKIAGVSAKFEAAKAAVATKSEITSLEKALKGIHVDPSLLSVLPKVLTKDPAARGDFDAATIGSLDSDLSKKLADIDAEIAPMMPAKTARAGEVATAQAAHDAAKDARDAVKAALKDAGNAVSAADKDLDAAEDAEKNFAHTLKVAKGKKDDAEEELASFRTGPLAGFARCKAQATPPPLVEETAAPAADAPPAAA